MAARTSASPNPVAGADTIDRLAGLSEDSALAALRHRRAEVRRALQGCADAVLGSPDTEPPSSALDRALVGLRVASLLKDAALAALYADRARRLGAKPGVLGRVSADDEEDTAVALNARLTAMLGFVDRLVLQPAVATARHLEQLARLGFDVPSIVGLAQAAGFVACQARLLTGLRALAALPPEGVLPTPVSGDPIPGTHQNWAPPPIRGRFTLDALQWRPWLPAVDPGQASPDQAALLRDTAPSARRSPYERTLLHNPALRRPHAALVASVAQDPLGLPLADRVLAAVVVSRIDGCTYGASTLGRIFARMTRDPEVVGTLFAQGVNVPLAARRRAIADLAVDLSAAQPSVSADRLQALRWAGLTELEILDALHAIAIAAWDDRLALSLGEAVGPGQD